LTPLRAGEVNEELLDLVRTKVRVPEQTIGDLMANVSCTEVGGRVLLELMDDYGLDDLDPLADALLDFSQAAIRSEIRKIPAGMYRHAIQLEGPLDGADGTPTPSPSNMTGTPVEVWTNLTSMTIEGKVLLADSGGPGAFRGGLALEIVLGAEGDDAISRAVVALSPGPRGGADPATWARAERTHRARREEAHHDIRRRGVRGAVQPGVERA
jgi:N-methylhydantoinase B/oxoprolinase/acetone carboxylase alpha subunit